ncbi:hypothetical protein D3C81_597720 [compost metagenome]
MTTPSFGGRPSGLFQTNSRLFSSHVSQLRVLAFGGMRLQYGISTHLPRVSYFQWWNGHTTVSFSRVPWDRSAPMCGQNASRMLIAPALLANATRRVPNALRECSLPSR